MSEPMGGAGRTVLTGAVVATLALCAFQAVWTIRVRDSLAEMKTSLARIDAIESSVDKFATDQDFLVDDINRLSRKVDGLVETLERWGPREPAPGETEAADVPGADQPPPVDWTQPQLFELAKKSAAEYGIELTTDEVRVPARFVIRQGAIEYFAVLKGGKEHETLISLVGNVPKTERRPKQFGARLNNAVLALGFKRGKPVRYTSTGLVPPQGETAYLFIEWEEKGEKVLVRAEDLVWNRIEERPMERGKWVYVGSKVGRTGDGADWVFAADVTGEAVATYSSPETIFDNTTSGESDDTTYLSATPRIPADIEDCTLVIRRTDRSPTRTFPDPGGAAPKEGGTPK